MASLTAWKWLYIPGLGLLGVYYLMPFVLRRAKNAATDREHHGV